MAETVALQLEQARTIAGVWEGLFSGVKGAVPGFEVLCQGRPVEGVEVQAVAGKAGRISVRVPIPAAAVSDGVQTFLVRANDATVASFTIVAGEPLEADLRAEISLLRAELDLLKRAFQRHVREG